jgi:uncharacterized protein YbjT (DUF2867 family)
MILVTGATGTVGSYLVPFLLDQGVSFCAGIHRRPLEIEGVQTKVIDYDQPETLLSAQQGVRQVFLILSLYHDERVMLASARNMIAAAQARGVERIVKMSTYAADQESFPHARWHRRVERMIEASGLAWTFLRPNAFMQTLLDEWADSIRNEGVFYDAVEGAGYAPIDVRDIARVTFQVLTDPGHEGKAYELTGPETLSWDQAAETLSQALGRPIRYVRISDEQLRQSLLEKGFTEEMAMAWVEVHRYVRRNPSTVTTSVRDITGSKPLSFTEFCRYYAPQLFGQEGSHI